MTTDGKRDAYLRRTYGITLKQYERLLADQGGKCAICERTPKQLGKNLHVDHDHVTMAIRGLLCAHCNHRVVGRHRDPRLLIRAGAYLGQTPTKYIVPKRKRRKRKKKNG